MATRKDTETQIAQLRKRIAETEATLGDLKEKLARIPRPVLLPSTPRPSTASSTADQSSAASSTQPRSRAKQESTATQLTHPPARPTPIPTDPKRSPQSLIAPRRESPQQSKAAPRRARPYEVGRGATHERGGTRARIRPDTTAIPTSRSL